jgi:hypothetical protein
MLLTEICINETAEENQIVNLIVREITNAIADLAKSKPKSWLAQIFATGMFDDFDKLNFFGIKLSDLNIPTTSSPVINAVLDTVKIRLMPDDSGIKGDDLMGLADYSMSNNEIGVYFDNIIAFCKKKNKDITDVMQSSIAHEIQHAIDNFKSNGKAFNKKNVDVKVGDDDAYSEYLKLPYEINARFTQALHSIQIALDKNEPINIAVANAFKEHELTKDVVPNYNRLLTRAIKFFDATKSNPKEISKRGFVERAKAWILGGATTIIK